MSNLADKDGFNQAEFESLMRGNKIDLRSSGTWGDEKIATVGSFGINCDTRRNFKAKTWNGLANKIQRAVQK